MSADMTPDRIRAIRRKNALTQEGLARELGVSVSAVHGWEQGTRKPGGPARLLLSMMERDK